VSHEAARRGLLPTLACGVAAVVVVTYLPSLWCDFIYDDFLVIHARPIPQVWGEWGEVFTTRQADNLPYYRPLTWLTVDLQNAWHGTSAPAFHAANVLLASAWAVLLFWLFLSRCFQLSPATASLASLAVVLHPVSACAIYPVSSGRESLLAALAMTAAVAAWLRPGPRWKWGGWGLLGVGLLCREQAIVVPVIFLTADALSLTGERPASWRRWAQRYLPGVVVVAGYLAVRQSLFGGTGEHRLAVFDHWAGPFQTAGYTLQTLLSPSPGLIYEPEMDQWWNPVRGLLAMGGLVALAASIRRAIRQHGATAWRILAFWLAWAAVVMAPTANLLGQQTPLAERYSLLVTVGLAGCVAMCIRLGGWHWQSDVFGRRLAAALAVLLLSVLAGLGGYRGLAYQTHEGFLEQWVSTVPGSAQAHLSLAGVLLGKGHDVRAERHLDRALELQPDYAEALDGKGRVLFHRGEVPAAEMAFRQAVAAKPSYAESWNHLGFVIERQGRLDEAAAACRKAISLDGELAEAHNNLGIILAQQQDLREAIGALSQAVALSPDYLDAWVNLGRVLQELGQEDEARRVWRRVLQLDPAHPEARSHLRTLSREGM